ncbi:hypothetical protein [Methylorubrum extorquens]|uniref:hypothetical protein n=1 Tax=Methylorubrum extorquens TaxID=408 RepID=UPI00209F874D|nr:hypothetical protein [Methylorubrum extorquens]MCP1540030.1 hypothetical protein [Methylorubrum extorquens]
MREAITVPNTRRWMPPLLEALTSMARAEVIVALREPQRQLVTLLHNRSAVLAQQEAEEAALNAELAVNDTWGSW